MELVQYPFRSSMAGAGNLTYRHDNLYILLQSDCFSQNGRACLPDEMSPGRDGEMRPEPSGKPPEKEG